jgi:hypothetical protein
MRMFPLNTSLQTYGPRTTCYNRLSECGGLASGTRSWMRLLPVMTRRLR